MRDLPSQCKLCINRGKDGEVPCTIYEQLPGEYGREEVKDCPSFFEEGTKAATDLQLLEKYLDEEVGSTGLEEKVTKAVNDVLSNYESKYKVMIVGIARRKIKSIIRMVDLVDAVLDKLSGENIVADMSPAQAIRLLSELNSSINNDLTFVMKLVNPDTKLQDLQVWIDNRSVVNTSGASEATELKAEEMLNLSGASRDKIREAFSAILQKLGTEPEEMIDVSEESEESEDEQ